MASPVNLTLESRRPLVDVESCIVNRWQGTPITIPSGVRVMFADGTAIVELTSKDGGTSIAIRAWRIERARVYRTVKNCAAD